MYYIIWGPGGNLLQKRYTYFQCGHNVMDFKTKEQAFKYIAESDRFQDYERELCFVVKEINQ